MIHGRRRSAGTWRSLRSAAFSGTPASTAALNDTELTNYDFLEALRHLAYTRQDKMLRPVDYHNLGAEELGGVYESLPGTDAAGERGRWDTSPSRSSPATGGRHRVLTTRLMRSCSACSTPLSIRWAKLP